MAELYTCGCLCCTSNKFSLIDAAPYYKKSQSFHAKITDWIQTANDSSLSSSISKFANGTFSANTVFRNFAEMQVLYLEKTQTLDKTGSIPVTDEEILDAPASADTDYSIEIDATDNNFSTHQFLGYLGKRDSDWIKLILNGNSLVDISLNGNGSSTELVDPYLYLYDSSLSLIASNDDSNGTRDSFISTYLSGGTYYIDVSSFRNRYSGDYILTVDEKESIPWDSEKVANYLVEGYWGSSGPRQFDTTVNNVITYNLGNLSDEYKAYARIALSGWASIGNFSFEELTTEAQINFSSSGNSQAYCSSSVENGRIIKSDIVVSQPWSIPQYNLQTFSHELGHAIGFGHAGPYNGSADYGVDNVYINDSWAETIMSYFSQEENDYLAGFNFTSNAFLLTPGIADIWAIEQTYGLDLDTRKENTVYGFNTTELGSGDFVNFDGNESISIYSDSFIGGEASWTSDGGTKYGYALTIYDTGGRDTINLSNSGDDNKIDLARGASSDTGTFFNNITIFDLCDIENAFGGFGNDSLSGNMIDNNFFLRFGETSEDLDYVYGFDGTDTLYLAEYYDLNSYSLDKNTDESIFADFLLRKEGSGGIYLSGVEYIHYLDYTSTLDGEVWTSSAEEGSFNVEFEQVLDNSIEITDNFSDLILNVNSPSTYGIYGVNVDIYDSSSTFVETFQAAYNESTEKWLVDLSTLTNGAYEAIAKPLINIDDASIETQVTFSTSIEVSFSSGPGPEEPGPEPTNLFFTFNKDALDASIYDGPIRLVIGEISNIQTQLKGKRNVQVDTVTGLNFDDGDQIQHFAEEFEWVDAPDGFTGDITETGLQTLFNNISTFTFDAYKVCLLNDGSNQYLAFNDDIDGWGNDGLIKITGYLGDPSSGVIF